MTATAKLPATSVAMVEIDQIHIPDNDGRLEAGPLRELAETMKLGLIQPIRIREKPSKQGRFLIVAGRRRIAAAKLLGWTEIAATIAVLTDLDAALEQLNENLQRENLHAIDEGAAFREVMKAPGMTLQNLSARTGKPEDYLRDRMRLGKLAPPVAKLFRGQKITTGQAIALAKISPEDQEHALKDGGVFHESYNFDIQFGPDVDDKQLPVTVAETEAWIATNVKLDVARRDALDLFPATQANLAQAEEKKLAVVEIATLRSFEIPPKQKKSVLSEEVWKRVEKKDCPSAQLGVVVLGPGRGTSFRVCVDRKCKVHFPKSTRSAPSHAVHRETPAEKARRAKDALDRQKFQLARDRWKKAEGKMTEALAKALTKAPVTPKSPLGALLIAHVGYIRPEHKKTLAPGATAESLLRYIAFHTALDEIYDAERGAKLCRSLGVDVKKILDEVAPIQPAAPAKKGKGAQGRAGKAR